MARESFSFAYPAGKIRREPGEPERFTAGGVFAASIQVLLRNALPLGVITAVVGIPYIVMVFTGLAPAPFFYRVTTTSINISSTGFDWNGSPAGIVLALTYLLVQCAVSYATFQSLLGRPVLLGQSFTRGLGTAIKVILASIVILIVAVAVIAVAVFLIAAVPLLGIVIIPAIAICFIVLYIMWWVVVPVIVVEGGFMEAFRRSRGLTKGNRWGILGLFLIVSVADVAISLAITGIAFAVGVAASEALALIVALVSIAFTAVLRTVGYYKLRAEKEGINIDALAAVFD